MDFFQRIGTLTLYQSNTDKIQSYNSSFAVMISQAKVLDTFLQYIDLCIWLDTTVWEWQAPFETTTSEANNIFIQALASKQADGVW